MLHYKRLKVKYPEIKGHTYPWKTEIIPGYVIPFLNAKRAKGMKPTVRGAFYALEKNGIIEKTAKIARKFTRAMGTARDNGQIPMNAFADNTRQIIKHFNDRKRSLTDYIDDGIARFRGLPDGFQTLVPRWLDQPNYVEVFVEKDAMAESVEFALKGLDVIIVPNRGWSSKTFAHNNIQRLIQEFQYNNRKNIWVLYLGDLDPSGWAMDKKITSQLHKNLGTRATFKRIGVTEEQLDKYNLRHLTNPDPKIISKFRNPKNRFVRPFVQHFGSAFQIELETLDALDDFEKIIRAEVDKLYNQKIRKQVLKRPEYSQEPGEIKEQIVDALKDLIVELEE